MKVLLFFLVLEGNYFLIILANVFPVQENVALLKEKNKSLTIIWSKFTIHYFLYDISMVKLKDKIVRICELKIVNGSHVHNLCYGKLLDPALVSFYTQ